MSSGHPAGLRGTMPARSVVHLELHTGDLARACAFYGALCGWRAERIASYTALDMGEQIGGGVVECGSGQPLWLPYVEVPDVDRATGRAEELGASVVLAPRSGPTGRRAVLASPAGGEVAFWQPTGRG
jgi:predicted enzyme related to lactoylglutathione lyase